MKLGKSKTTKKTTSRVKQKADTEKDKAKAVVKEFEVAKENYLAEKELWEDEHPEAAEHLMLVEDKKDLAESLWNKAKKAVAAAQETVGDFKCQLPKTTPGYDGSVLLEHLVKTTAEDEAPKTAGEWLAVLYDQGVITGLTLNKDAARVVHQSGDREDLKDLLDLCHDPGGKPLTPRVSGPKW